MPSMTTTTTACTPATDLLGVVPRDCKGSYGSFGRQYKDGGVPLGNYKRAKTPESQTLVGQAFHLPRTFCQWLGGLKKHTSLELLIAIVAAEHLVKGFNHGLSSAATGLLWRAYQVEAANVQTFTAIAAMPWCLQPIIGVISDLVPLFGYRKAPYVMAASVLGAACYAAIGADFSSELPAELVMVLLLGCNLQGSVCSLLTQAQYSEQLSESPKCGPDLVSFVSFGQTVMSLVVILIIGPLLGVGGPHLVFLACVLPASIVLWPMSRNYLGERYQTVKEASETRARLSAVWEVFVPVFAMLFAAVALTVCALVLHSTLLRLIVALACLGVVLTSVHVALRPEISRIACFYIIQAALRVSFSGASLYFYTDGEEELPDGPHLSKGFFTTALGSVGAVSSLFGVWLYVAYFKHWGYRRLLYAANAALCLVYLLDTVQFARVNKRMGISDHYFALGSCAVQRVVERIAWMPQVLVISQLCPKGLEGTMYAILAGSMTFGESTSSFIGAYLLEVCGINPRGAVGDAASLSWLWLPCAVSAVLPASMVLLVPFMIPNIDQTSEVLLEDPSSPCIGSPLSRWLARQRATAAWSRRMDSHLG